MIYVTPSTPYPWPTGDRLTSRLNVPRGISVITDGHGGWTTTENPYLGVIRPLTEGVDYFLGGHTYDIDPDVGLSLFSAGLFPDYTAEADDFLYPGETEPSYHTYPEG